MKIFISNMQNRHKKPYKLGDQEYRARYLHIFKVIQQLYSYDTIGAAHRGID